MNVHFFFLFCFRTHPVNTIKVQKQIKKLVVLFIIVSEKEDRNGIYIQCQSKLMLWQVSDTPMSKYRMNF